MSVTHANSGRTVWHTWILMVLVLMTWTATKDAHAAVIGCFQSTPPNNPAPCLNFGSIWCVQDAGGGCAALGPPNSYTSCSSASPPYPGGYQKCQWTGGPPVSACSPGLSCAYDGTTGTCMNSGTCLPNTPYCAASSPSHWGTLCFGGSLEWSGYCANDACMMMCAPPGSNAALCPQPTFPSQSGNCVTGGGGSGTCQAICSGQPYGYPCTTAEGSSGTCDGGGTCVVDMPLFEEEND